MYVQERGTDAETVSADCKESEGEMSKQDECRTYENGFCSRDCEECAPDSCWRFEKVDVYSRQPQEE